MHPFDQKKRAFVTPTQVEPLLKCYWEDGKVQQVFPSLAECRNLVLKQIKDMRPDHLRVLNPTPYKVSVSQELFNFVHDLWLEGVPIPDISL